MSGRPSRVKQREIQQVIKGAMKAGATKVVVQLGEASITIHATEALAVAAVPNEWLADDKHQA